MGNQALEQELLGSKKFIKMHTDQLQKKEDVFCEICMDIGYTGGDDENEAKTCVCMEEEDMFNNIDNKL